MLNRIGLASLASVLVVTSAMAADLPVKAYTKAPLLAPVSAYNWSGFYVGGHLGMAGSKICFDQVSPVPVPPNLSDSGCQDSHGILGGGQIGYNLQYSKWLLGAEFSGSGLDVAARHTPAANSVSSNLEFTSDTKYLLMLTGRVGLTWNNILAYVKGGGAWTRNSYSIIEIGQPTLFANTSRSGWTIGGGVEYGFAPNWSLGIEYNHIDFGNSDLVLRPAYVIAADQKIDVVTARLNYHFVSGWAPF